MKISIFTVFDQKASAFLQPFFSPTVGTAIRAFSDTINDPNSMLSKHPADFTLFEIGGFDDQSGVVDSLTSHINHGVGLQFVKETTIPFDFKEPTKNE